MKRPDADSRRSIPVRTHRCRRMDESAPGSRAHMGGAPEGVRQRERRWRAGIGIIERAESKIKKSQVSSAGSGWRPDKKRSANLD